MGTYRLAPNGAASPIIALAQRIGWRAATRAAAGVALTALFLVLADGAAAAEPIGALPGAPEVTVAEPTHGTTAEAATADPLANPEPPVVSVEPAVPEPAVNVTPNVEPVGLVVEPQVTPLGAPLVNPLLDPAAVVVEPLATVGPISETLPVEPSANPVVASPPNQNAGPNDDLRRSAPVRPPVSAAHTLAAASDAASPGVPDERLASVVGAERARQADVASNSVQMPQLPQQPARPDPIAGNMSFRAGSGEQLPLIGALAASVLLLGLTATQFLAPALVAMRGRPVLVAVPPG